MKRSSDRLTSVQVAMEYPLPLGASIWALIVSVLTLIGWVPSLTINELPWIEGFCWAIFGLIGALTVLWGLFVSRRVQVILRGLVLVIIVIVVYYISIIANIGWQITGATVSFPLIISAVLIREGVVLRARARRHGISEEA